MKEKPKAPFAGFSTRTTKIVSALVLAFALISSYPPGILFALFLAYAASGYVFALVRWRRRRQNRLEATTTSTTQAVETATPAAPEQGDSSDPGSKS